MSCVRPLCSVIPRRLLGSLESCQQARRASEIAEVAKLQLRRVPNDVACVAVRVRVIETCGIVMPVFVKVRGSWFAVLSWHSSLGKLFAFTTIMSVCPKCLLYRIGLRIAKCLSNSTGRSHYLQVGSFSGGHLSLSSCSKILHIVQNNTSISWAAWVQCPSSNSTVIPTHRFLQWVDQHASPLQLRIVPTSSLHWPPHLCLIKRAIGEVPPQCVVLCYFSRYSLQATS